jgi:hypothetical protein
MVTAAPSAGGLPNLLQSIVRSPIAFLPEYGDEGIKRFIKHLREMIRK